MPPLSGLAAAMLLFLAADGHRQRDKAQHFLLSALYGAAAGLALRGDPGLSPGRRLLWAVILGSGPGLIKEYIDEGEDGNRFDYADLRADMAGALAGALLAGTRSGPAGRDPEAARWPDYV